MKYWHDINTEPPAPGETVLFACETYPACSERPRSYIVMGVYAEAKAVICGDDMRNAEYDEDTDEYYLPAGYYEKTVNWNDYEYAAITDDVTHWRRLPGLPKKQKPDENGGGEQWR